MMTAEWDPAANDRTSCETRLAGVHPPERRGHRS